MFRITISPRLRMTPYHDSMVAAGATDITIYNKMVLPLSFGDPAAEYDRLINGVAMWDVSVERQVQISGPDAHLAVQYFTSRDISNMVEGQGKYVAMCDHAGRILNDPVLMKLSGNRYWFSIADNDILLWCKAIVAERGFDAEVTEPDVSPLAIQGPKAEDLIAGLFGEHVRNIKLFRFIETELLGIPLVLSRSGWSKQGGFELFLQDASRGNELWQLIAAAGEPYGIGPGAPNPVERVESGLLSYGNDHSPNSNPFEVGMGRYVDTDTDVEYIGKAALQAVVSSGGPELLFIGLNIEDELIKPWPLPERAPILVGEEQVGTLASIVHSHRLGHTIGLGQVLRSVVEAGDTVSLSTPDGPVSATVQELPFL